MLPPELREFAQLGRHGMLIGQGNRFELWDEARWNERRDLWLKNEKPRPICLPSSNRCRFKGLFRNELSWAEAHGKSTNGGGGGPLRRG